MEAGIKTAYVVLGMHRSGTSSVAGALSLLGARAPRHLMGPKPENPSGFWESEKITEFNEEIFAAAKSSWTDWGPVDPEVFHGPHSGHLHSASRWLLGAEFGGGETIVLKDPRICRVYPFWRSVLEDCGYRPLIVSPIRPPEEVAASLIARNGMARPHALRLWLHHVLEAERTTRGEPRHIMAWSDFIADWRSQVARLETTLGGQLRLTQESEAAVDAFLNPSLRRQRLDGDAGASAKTPELVERAFSAMSAIATNGETAEAHSELDRVTAALRDDMRLYYDGPRRL